MLDPDSSASDCKEMHVMKPQSLISPRPRQPHKTDPFAVILLPLTWRVVFDGRLRKVLLEHREETSIGLRSFSR